MRLRLRVPASSANLGAGFDCLALALRLFKEVTVEVGQGPSLAVSGAGSDRIPADHRNLVLSSLRTYFEAVGEEMPDLAIAEHNEIPLNGGLGASAAAVVAGLLAGREIAHRRLSDDNLLTLAYRIEGHADNVAAALFGGLTVSAIDDEKVIALKVPIPADLKAVLFLPDFSIPTRLARRILPKRVLLSDAVHNLSRATLFVAALRVGRPELLRVAMQDRLHQPYRARLFPTMLRLIEAAEAAGALGAGLSGAGSTIIALVKDQAEEVEAAFRWVSSEAGVKGRSMVVALCQEGAWFERNER